MQLNCTYRLIDSQAFIEFVAGASMNRHIAEHIKRQGGTIRPLKYDSDGDVVAWAYPDGTSSSIAVDDWFISKTEFQYFTKVNEGYPERDEFVSNEMELNIVVKNKEQAQKAIKMLEEYLK